MRSPCSSRVRVQPCCDPYTGSYGKKKVRINPVVERTTLLAPRSHQRQYMSDDYEGGCRQSRRAESIGRRSRRCQSPLDSYSDVETNTYPYGLFAGASEKSRRNYGSVRGNSRYVPCSQPSSNHARMRSPQRERPLYDDEDDYIPRPQRIGQRAAMRPPCAPLYDNNNRNVIYHRKNHHFARGDTLTHKNLTRTYVFHRQPFDWYDSNQGVVLDDIEQILEPEDLFEPDDLPPPPPPPSQQQSIRTGRVPFVPRTVIYEQPVPMSNRSRPVERSTVVVPSVPSGGGGSIGGSNHFYDDVYVGSNLDTVSTGGDVTSRPSPPRNTNQFVSDKDRPSAFRSPSNSSSRYCDDVSKNSSPSSKNYFVIEKESSTPNGVKTTFRSSEFMSPPLVNEPIQKFNGLPRPGNQTDGRRATFDMSDDINRIMRKFDEIGINDKPKK